MLEVAFRAATVGGVPAVTIRSTLRCTSSAARAGNRSLWPSESRFSIVKCWPSIQPDSRIAARNVSASGVLTNEEPLSQPIRSILRGCWADATLAQTSAPPIASMNFRRSMLCLGLLELRSIPPRIAFDRHARKIVRDAFRRA